MNILVTGANGQLGCALRCAPALRRHHVVFTDIADLTDEARAMLSFLGGGEVDTQTLHLDVTDAETVAKCCEELRINVIVNCAAYTNVDAAESDRERARLLNERVPEQLAMTAKLQGIMLVHVSTDYVFGSMAQATPLREDAPCAPLSVYGSTKRAGEEAIISVAPRHVILRTAWLYSEFGRNFVRTMLRLTAERPALNVVYDQVGTPTYAHDLAAAIAAIVSNYEAAVAQMSAYNADWECTGVYHYTDEGVCSWYDFTQMIARIAHHEGCMVSPIRSEQYPTAAVRPAFSVLDKAAVKSTFSLEIPYWVDSLKTCINNITKCANTSGQQ